MTLAQQIAQQLIEIRDAQLQTLINVLNALLGN